MLLRCCDKGAQLDEVDREGAVVVLRIAENPVVQADKRLWIVGYAAACRRRRSAGHMRDNQRFKTLFAGIGRHAVTRPLPLPRRRQLHQIRHHPLPKLQTRSALLQC